MAKDSHSSHCKGCMDKVEITDHQINRMVSSLETRNFECVTNDIYEDRLAACQTCPALKHKNTCMHCGCIVQVRAKLKESHCPFPGHSKWASLN